MRALHTLIAAGLILWPDRFVWFVPALVLLFAASLARGRDASRGDPRDAMLALVHPLVGGLIVLIDALRFDTLSGLGFWVAGPLVWLMWRHAAAELGSDLGAVLHHAIVAAGWVCLAVNGGYVAAILLGYGDSFSLAGISGYFGLDERGFFAYSTSLLPHIGYIVPYLAWQCSRRAPRRGEVVLLAGLILVGLLSLRIAIGITVAASLGLIAWRRWGAKRVAAAAVAAALGIALGALVIARSPELSDVARGIYDLKLSDKVSGDDLRFEQIAFWWRSFLDAPLAGHGFSSSTIELTDMVTGDSLYSRTGTVDNPFGYEVLFFRMLSEVGLLLVPVMLGYAVLMLRATAAQARAGQVGAMRFAALMMVIQSQTNSYLNTSGWFFVFYFCIALIDTRRRPRAPAHAGGARRFLPSSPSAKAS